MQIKDAVVFITGANRGLGLAYARAALAAGAKKVYAAARDPKSVTLEGVVPVALDVTQPAQVEAAARACGDVNLVINNAGISRGSGLLSSDALDAAKAEFDTNFFGLWAVSRAFAPVLAKNGGGAIVNVLSIASWINSPLLATYGVSKAAAWAFTNGLRIELEGQGTQVLGLHAGFIDTDMTRDVTAPKSTPESVVTQALDALERGDSQVLTDELTRQVHRGLTAERPVYLAALGASGAH
jgi:NAD(P)-dependent dehydrogenase (short-subunit alcohol dehydrogenase family)